MQEFFGFGQRAIRSIRGQPNFQEHFFGTNLYSE